MDGAFLLLRLVHVLGGMFWVGAVLMTVFFLFKVVADMGPAGGQVTGGLMKHRYFDVLPAIALLTVLSGIDLLRRVSGGFQPAYMGSPIGITYSIGALAGLLALAVGVGVGRRMTVKALALGKELAAMPDGPDKAARMAELGTLRARSQMALRVAALLLVIASVCMAIARYV
ncbi:MAG: hypothetical protein JNL26_18590 [Gemmatimonadetes bacterium]|nr:hypothetical protein [Gemmatimonadota bacterium]